ncbi:DUF4349 domain-containing protein [Cryobacterium algoritolerans]|uniref:DUF4349 domain-containing protein n=1 Tax=Cryobacterium algoritolerans TaxID=1259184 RepID=A0A4R8WN32_9MICO|nr:DUF4349 domain-containing protein [Cryobacterium algoritolerans]TFC12412.1 DUF4349 domain-containing protein [Cryobacterium algoritolerans]
MKRIPIAALAVAVLLLAGCSAQGSSTSGSNPGGTTGSDSSGGVVGAPQPGAPDSAVKDGTTGEVKSSNRDVITTGSVSITVADPIRSAQDAVTITEQAGGRIDSRTENPATPNQPASANLTLRIPSNELDRTIAELKKLGTVNFVSLNASDITQQTTDLDARITSLKTSVDRLLTLMRQAGNTTDLIAIESALSARQSELEGLQSQRNYLSDQVDFSTIRLDLYSTGTVAPGSPDSFWTGIVAGWNALVAALGGALIGIGFVLPWLLSLGAVTAIVLLIVWLSTRKRKAA